MWFDLLVIQPFILTDQDKKFLAKKVKSYETFRDIVLASSLTGLSQILLDSAKADTDCFQKCYQLLANNLCLNFFLIKKLI